LKKHNKNNDFAISQLAEKQSFMTFRKVHVDLLFNITVVLELTYVYIC